MSRAMCVFPWICILLHQLLPCRADLGEGTVGPEQRRATLAAELHGALGGGRRRAPTETDLRRIEEVIHPIFLALPKSQGGALSATAARYALHRAFIQLHGWHVKGLDSVGEAWGAQAPSLGLGGVMPEDLKMLFEQRLERGVDFHELASVVAALEHLIHGESEGRLLALYAALGRRVDTTLTETHAAELMDAYVATFVFGIATPNITNRMVRVVMQKVPKAYPAWPAARAFGQEVLRESLPSSGLIAFEDLEAAVEDFSQRFGRWQNSDCLDVKADLVALEERTGNGRVRLADFYNASLHQGKMFTESPEFLEQQGALDDSVPHSLRVVIPNYLNSPANCIANMHFYSVCCIDECEDLFGHLERHFQAPSAEPAAVAAAVAALPSSSVPSPRTLAPKLIARLNEVAAQHGGQVPLHGRLFAQWMHHVYPRECAFPHVSGTTTPRTIKEFKQQTGQTHKVTPEGMRQFIIDAGGAQKPRQEDGGDDDIVCTLPWDETEELVDPHTQRAAAARGIPRVRSPLLRGLASTMALGSLAAGLVRLARSLRQGDKSEEPLLLVV